MLPAPATTVPPVGSAVGATGANTVGGSAGGLNAIGVIAIGGRLVGGAANPGAQSAAIQNAATPSLSLEHAIFTPCVPHDRGVELRMRTALRTANRLASLRAPGLLVRKVARI